jgi:transposase
MTRSRSPTPCTARGAYRGITQLGALTLASEVGDWRRFPRAAGFTGFAAWCPRSIPAAARPGGATSPSVATSTCAPSWPGSAWALKHRPAVGVELRSRQQGLDPQVVARAWAAQLRLCGRFGRLAARKESKNVVVTAIARELAGFLWAEMAA